MKKTTLCSAVLLVALTVPAATPPPQPGWWLTPRRMIQTNLREIDARMDLDAYIAALVEARANVVLYNVGGIVANYATDLPAHYRNPFMRGPYAEEVIRRLHEADIRVIGRFDFSKVNEVIAREHPEWLSRDRDGNAYPPYNGQVPTCLNGGYQQEMMFEILAEAIDRLPLDGVFFNMIGYPTRDYSGRYLGICQCQGCKDRFHDMYGLKLPKDEDTNDPVFQKYQEFRQRTISDQFLRVNALIKGKNPGLAICTYTAAGVDVIRKESNRPHGRWTYEDSEKARLVLLDHPDQQLANAAVHFFHYPHRHTAVSPWLTQRRLYQQMINGAWLDFYCIGPFHALEDRLGTAQVRDVFGFHAANERWLTNTVELADVGLVVDAARGSDELRGLFRILSEGHFSFDLVKTDDAALNRYRAVIAPKGGKLGAEQAAQLDDYVRQGGKLLLTGPEVPAAITSLEVTKTLPPIAQRKGTYVRVRPEDKTRLHDAVFDDVDLLFLDGPLGRAEFAAGTQNLLRFIPPAMFGPPEKCYYTNVSDIPCLYARDSGKGAVAWLPWNVGAHYEQQGHPGHAALVRSILTSQLGMSPTVTVDASPLLEMNHRGDPAERFEWVSLFNLSGQMDQVLYEPLPVRDVPVRVRLRGRATSARLLKSGRRIPVHRNDDGSVECVVPEIGGYEIVLFVTKDN